MSEEAFDLAVASICFGLALYSWLRRRAVVNIANDVKGRIDDYAA